MSEWISVKDRLPEKEGIYIICDHYGNVMSRHFCKSHGKFAGYWHFNGKSEILDAAAGTAEGEMGMTIKDA